MSRPKNRCVVLSCFYLKFYRLPTTRCENDTIRHAFLSSFTVYRHEKARRFLVCQDPKTVALFLSCFYLKFYCLPTMCCENDSIRHAFLSSFTVYRHEKARRFLVCQDPKTVALFLSCFYLKFYRLPTTRCENDTISHAFLSSFTV